MKNFCENNINSDSGKLSLFVCGVSLFFTPFAELAEGWIFMFLEVVPRLVILHLLFLPVVHLLLLLFSSVSSNSYSTSLASVILNVSATRISLMASLSILIFFTTICESLCRLLYMTGHSCRNLMPWRYGLLLVWQQNRSKAMMWLLFKIPAIWGCARLFSKLMALCCMLLPNSPFRLPQDAHRWVLL